MKTHNSSRIIFSSHTLAIKTVTVCAVKLSVSAHPFCHPKVSVICHAGTRFVKVEAVYFVRTPTYLNISCSGKH